MHRIVLDAGAWSKLEDFYAALLPALGAPEWHGHNLNALWDSMIGGGINAVEPPYEVVLICTEPLGDTLRLQLAAFLDLVEQGHEEEGVEIYASAQPPL